MSGKMTGMPESKRERPLVAREMEADKKAAKDEVVPIAVKAGVLLSVPLAATLLKCSSSGDGNQQVSDGGTICAPNSVTTCDAQTFDGPVGSVLATINVEGRGQVAFYVFPSLNVFTSTITTDGGEVSRPILYPRVATLVRPNSTNPDASVDASTDAGVDADVLACSDEWTLLEQMNVMNDTDAEALQAQGHEVDGSQTFHAFGTAFDVSFTSLNGSEEEGYAVSLRIDPNCPGETVVRPQDSGPDSDTVTDGDADLDADMDSDSDSDLDGSICTSISPHTCDSSRHMAAWLTPGERPIPMGGYEVSFVGFVEGVEDAAIIQILDSCGGLHGSGVVQLGHGSENIEVEGSEADDLESTTFRIQMTLEGPGSARYFVVDEVCGGVTDGDADVDSDVDSDVDGDVDSDADMDADADGSLDASPDGSLDGSLDGGPDADTSHDASPDGSLDGSLDGGPDSDVTDSGTDGGSTDSGVYDGDVEACVGVASGDGYVVVPDVGHAEEVGVTGIALYVISAEYPFANVKFVMADDHSVDVSAPFTVRGSGGLPVDVGLSICGGTATVTPVLVWGHSLRANVTITLP